MKVKFVILQSNGANGYWSHLAPIPFGHLDEYQYGPKDGKSAPIAENFNHYFTSDVKDAVKYDTYEKAQADIEKLGKVTLTTVEGLKETVHHLGRGFYRIDKIFVFDKN